jgi:tryptophan-rich sensory protein
MVTTTQRVVPVGRGDHLIALTVHRADDLETTRALAALRATVAAQALTIAGQAATIADLEAEIAAGRRWYLLRRPTWEAPGWALPALGLLAWLGAALAETIDAVWDCRPVGE